MKRTIWLAVATFLLGGCLEAPRHTLSQGERTEDMAWLFSKLEENYAPLKYKEEHLKLRFADLREKYLREVAETKSNADFYLLIHRAVAELKDGHTSIVAPRSTLPNRNRIAYLGFEGERNGPNLLIKKLLPSISKFSAYPLKVGDQITKLDGRPLLDVIQYDLVAYQDTGNQQSNLTLLMPKLFDRSEVDFPLPKKELATLTVMRDKKELQIVLPWIIKDEAQFLTEQEKASKEEPKKVPTESGAVNESARYEIALKIFNGRPVLPQGLLASFKQGRNFNFWNNFFFLDTSPGWSSPLWSMLAAENNPEKNMVDTLKEVRKLPTISVFVQSKAIYPAFLFSEPILGKDKRPTGNSRVIGYLYLDTFEPNVPGKPNPDEPAEAFEERRDQKVLSEVASTLKTFQTLGVRDVIVDLIHNGGGSLSLGMRLAQLFSPKRLDLPEIQFKVSDEWMDRFESTSRNGLSDSEQEVARRILVGLEQDKGKGMDLSRRWTSESVAPFRMSPNAELTEPIHTTLLVDETCASMCDIFAALIKDNHLGTLVGTKTMGAGGGVEMTLEAPHSHFMLRYTTSLLVRSNGSYIENNPVEPDVPFDVVSTAENKFEPVFRKAVESIMAR